MAVVLSLDAGTTGVRTLAVAEDGSVACVAYRELTQHFPRPGWVEHDPVEIRDLAFSTVAEVAGAVDEPIAAIGITDQRETTVVWDRRTGRPLHRALVWQDRRTAARCDELAAGGHLDAVRATTGLVLDPYFSGTKLEWLLTTGAVEPTADLAFGTVDSWLIWCLTGGEVHATEPSNASRTLLFDIRTGAWSPEMTALLGIPDTCLPDVRPSSGRFGLTADQLDGVPAGVPISGAAGDQQSALFGQLCHSPGTTKNTYGTGSFVLMNVGTECPEPAEGLLTTVAWQLAGTTTYALEGAIFATGAAIQWLRDGLGLLDDASETGSLAGSVDDAGGVVVVPAFAGLGSPWWDPYARGTITGITRGTTAAHLARAVIESMAFQTRDVASAMAGAAGRPITELRVDGGASAMDLLLQLQADQIRVPVLRPTNHETTALGAAYLAGLAEGVWTEADLETLWSLDSRFEPRTDAILTDAAHQRWLGAVERSRGWANPNPTR